MAHPIDTLTKLAYGATNLQLQPLEGENGLIPSMFKEAVASTKIPRWEVASDKEIASLQAHKVYHLVPTTPTPPGKKVVSARWLYNVKADNALKVRMVVIA